MTGFAALATKTGTCNYFVGIPAFEARVVPKARHAWQAWRADTGPGAAAAKEELGKVARGADVAQERKDARAKLKAGTFRDLSESYFAANGKREKTGEWKSRHWKETNAMLEKLVYPVLGTKVPDAISRFELASLINETKARSHSVARRLHETLRPLFAWGFESRRYQEQSHDRPSVSETR